MNVTIASVLSTAHTALSLWWYKAQEVGVDQFGNTYMRIPPGDGRKKERRWVIYSGEPEASAVPPEWHAWLHHQSDVVPATTPSKFRRPWQQPHRPNQTGTDGAYRPPGHTLAATAADAGPPAGPTQHYEAWSPDD